MVNPMELLASSHILIGGVGHRSPKKKGYFMKLFLVSAAAAALAFASPALAQDHHDRNGHGGGNHGDSHGAPHAAPAAPAPKAAQPAPPKLNGHSGGPNASNTWRDRNGAVKTTASPAAVYQKAVQDAAARNQRDRDNNRHDSNNRHDNNRSDNNRHDNNNNSRGSNDRHDNNWNNNNHNSNHGSWQGKFNRRNVTAQHHYRYRGNSWRWPSGYRYQRWAFGMTLPSLFWSNNYWINDYSDYGLAYPPPGTVWVRYGNDAILIDRYSGEILEVVYGQFY
jgi:Ni/Co efflux regulator RcnB